MGIGGANLGQWQQSWFLNVFIHVGALDPGGLLHESTAGDDATSVSLFMAELDCGNSADDGRCQKKSNILLSFVACASFAA